MSILQPRQTINLLCIYIRELFRPTSDWSRKGAILWEKYWPKTRRIRPSSNSLWE